MPVAEHEEHGGDHGRGEAEARGEAGHRGGQARGGGGGEEAEVEEQEQREDREGEARVAAEEAGVDGAVVEEGWRAREEGRGGGACRNPRGSHAMRR